MFWIVTLFKVQPARSLFLPAQPTFQRFCCDILAPVRRLCISSGRDREKCSRVSGLVWKDMAAAQRGESKRASVSNRLLHFSCHWYPSYPSRRLSSPLTAPAPPPCDKWTNRLWYELSIVMPRLMAGLRAIGIRHPSAACPCLSFPGSGPLLRLAAQSPNFEFVGEAASQAQEKKNIAHVQSSAHSSLPSP